MSIVLTAGRLRMVFARAQDRWQHAVELVDGQSATRVLVSVEGDAAQVWPPSPPFQDLSEETLPDGRPVIFLVGRAGHSHWSASFEADEARAQIVCDIACRHTLPPEQLGSVYQQLSTGLSILPADGARVLAERDQLRIAPLVLAQRLPGTTQWKYVVQRAQ
jgi:hypothetical protein